MEKNTGKLVVLVYRQKIVIQIKYHKNKSKIKASFSRVYVCVGLM